MTAWASGSQVVHGIETDSLAVQEHRIPDPDACKRAEGAASRRWALSLPPAARTEAGGASAGVGIAVRAHTGLAHTVPMPRHSTTESRVCARHWTGVVKGGIMTVSIYLYFGEGLSRRNLDIKRRCLYVEAPEGPLGCNGRFQPYTRRMGKW